MKHWIGRVDIPSGNITPIKEVDSAEIAWKFIREMNSQQEQIDKENSELKIAKDNLQFNLPKYDKEVHVSLTKFIKLKTKIKHEMKEGLSEEDKKIYHAAYLLRVIPTNTKLVYMAIHELKDM